jgi:hypothetical protein
MAKHWGTHRANEEKLQRIRLGSRYVGLDLGQFYWECLKLAAASEELTETDILRRVIRSWSETVAPAIQEEARAETARVEAWKALELRAREEAQLSERSGRPLTGEAGGPGADFQRDRTERQRRLLSLASACDKFLGILQGGT